MKFIYALVDPFTKKVRYVGQTKNKAVRLREHIHGGPGARGRWIAGLRARGSKPIMRTLERCDDSVANARERHWIWRYLGPKLLNVYPPLMGDMPKPPPLPEATISRLRAEIIADMDRILSGAGGGT